MIATFLKCSLGPRLIRIYRSPGKTAFNYVPSVAEKMGDFGITLMKWSLQFGIYTSPVIIWILYKRNYFSSNMSLDGLQTLIRFCALCASLLISSFVVRAIGRQNNSIYVTFINNLDDMAKSVVQTKQVLTHYDFEFSSWPIEYHANELDKDSDKPRLIIEPQSNNSSISITRMASQVLGYIVAHSIGIRLLYPGTIIQHFIDPHLIEGRARFIEEHQGRRYKIIAKDGNSIDVMSVDRRNRLEYSNGNILVICCEGNAGFYEVGMIGTPLDAGYSVLGWNHPGFGGSTGSPFPHQEQNAIDIVMQFAINKLKFPTEKIVLYGWSIGGYTASWAAMNYNVRGLMLDATFDHILPLAANVMPTSWKSIVAVTVKNNMNLAVADQVTKYNGPVVLFRRTRDEIISLEPGKLERNRGNDLLIKLLEYRYPRVVDLPLLRQWLGAESNERAALLHKFDVNNGQLIQNLKQYINENGISFPMLIGENWVENKKSQMTLYLANRHMVDFDSTHCTPLPTEFFYLPLEIGLNESDLSDDFVEIAPGDIKI